MNKFNTFIEDVRSEFKWKGFLTVIGAFLFSLSIVGLHGVVKNQFTLPVAEDLGVGKAAVSSWDSFAQASGIVTAALIGTIYKKLGPRWLAIVAGLTVCLGYVIVATTNSLNLFYAAGYLIGNGQASAGGLMIFTIV